MLEKKDILRISQLARLELSEEEQAIYQEQLGRILDHFKELEKLEVPEKHRRIMYPMMP